MVVNIVKKYGKASVSGVSGGVGARVTRLSRSRRSDAQEGLSGDLLVRELAPHERDPEK
jgi:hypothetical protein